MATLPSVNARVVRAAAFRGRSRERMIAIGAAAELFFQLCPDSIQIENTIRISSIREKASDQRRACLETCESRCAEVVQGVIRDAVAAGDLQLSHDFGVEDLSFGLWSITFGGYSIVATSPSLASLGIHEPLLAIRYNAMRLLDGAGWKPLSSGIDLPALVERIRREVFAAEYAELERRR